MSLNIVTRTTDAQMENIRNLLLDVPDLVIHSMTHNLDGLWLNVYFTDTTGDWVRSIHRDGHYEETQ